MPDSSSTNSIPPVSGSALRSRRNFLCGSAAAVAGVVAAGIYAVIRTPDERRISTRTAERALASEQQERGRHTA